MWVVDIHADTLEEVCDAIVLRVDAVDHVLVLSIHVDLSSNNDFITVVVSDWRFFFVPIVECYRDCSSSYACLSILKERFLSEHGLTELQYLVNKIIKRRRSDLSQLRDSKQEANRVQNITLSRSIESGYSVEERVEVFDLSSPGVRFEPIQLDAFYVHFDPQFRLLPIFYSKD